MDWNNLSESMRAKPTPGSNAHKLSWKQVNEIRKRYAEGDITLTRLAGEYKVNPSTILRIVRYVYW